MTDELSQYLEARPWWAYSEEMILTHRRRLSADSETEKGQAQKKTSERQAASNLVFRAA